MHEFTMVFVLNVDHAPFVGARSDHFTVDIEGLLRTYDRERDFILRLVLLEWRSALIWALRASSSSSNSSLS